MKKEIWRPVKNYEGYYEVSNLGRIRSVDRVIIHSDGRKRLFKGRILKTAKDKKEYLFCSLSKNSKVKTPKIHRLVAQAFLPNPNNLPQINHKDENKANNCVFVNKDGSVDLNKSNLEWCTCQYNLTYGTRLKRQVETQSKTVLQIDINTEQVISEYPSAKEAGRQLNISQGHISACCRGEQRHYKGFKWLYKKE